jgi:hypothetical protein
LPGKERNRLLCSVHTGQTGNFPLPDAGKFLIEYDLLPTKCAAEGSFTKNPRSKDRGSAIVVGKRLQRLDLVKHLVGLADRSSRCLEFGSLRLDLVKHLVGLADRSSRYLEGEYGQNDICIGVPAVIGRKGIEKIVKLDLTKEEAAKFEASAAAVRKTNQVLHEIKAL